jgi:hypothetical protein
MTPAIKWLHTYASDYKAKKISNLVIQFKQMLAVITSAGRKCSGLTDKELRQRMTLQGPPFLPPMQLSIVRISDLPVQ